jgi:DNA-binding XRE family transcriptional regulator
MKAIIPGTELVKMVRDHLRWTQARLAEELELSLKTIGRWERGMSEPRVSDYQRLQALLRRRRRRV